MRRWLICAISALPPACAGLSHAPCTPEDWRAIGYQEAATGAPHSTASEAWQACAERSGAEPDGASYLAGWRDGRAAYCTAETGFSEGVRGAAYEGICEGEAATRFVAAFDKGRRLFELQASVIRTARALSDAQAGLWDARRRVSEIEITVASTAISREERSELLGELKSLTEESRRLESTLVGLAQDKMGAEQDLTAFRAALANEGVVAPGEALRPSNAAY